MIDPRLNEKSEESADSLIRARQLLCLEKVKKDKPVLSTSQRQNAFASPSTLIPINHDITKCCESDVSDASSTEKTDSRSVSNLEHSNAAYTGNRNLRPDKVVIVVPSPSKFSINDDAFITSNNNCDPTDLENRNDMHLDLLVKGLPRSDDVQVVN